MKHNKENVIKVIEAMRANSAFLLRRENENTVNYEVLSSEVKLLDVVQKLIESKYFFKVMCNIYKLEDDK